MKTKARGRRLSREIALQILYQMDMTNTSPDEAVPLYFELLAVGGDPEVDAPHSFQPFAEKIVRGVFHYRSEIDQMIVSASENWRLERMSIVDRSILRLALFEMLHCPDIPPKVSINEAIDLGKTFGSADSGAFINGILDHFLPLLAQEQNDKKVSSA